MAEGERESVSVPGIRVLDIDRTMARRLEGISDLDVAKVFAAHTIRERQECLRAYDSENPLLSLVSVLGELGGDIKIGIGAEYKNWLEAQFNGRERKGKYFPDFKMVLPSTSRIYYCLGIYIEGLHVEGIRIDREKERIIMEREKAARDRMADGFLAGF